MRTTGDTKAGEVYVLEERYLFSGESLAWSDDQRDLIAFHDACCWSWPAQADSLDRLAATSVFQWVLPGHGARVRLEPADAEHRLRRLVQRMRAA